MTEYIKNWNDWKKCIKLKIQVLSHYFKSDWCNCKCSFICSRHWNFKQCSRINWPTKLCNKFYYWNISPNTFQTHRYSRRKAAFWTDWCRCFFFFLLLTPCQDWLLGFPVEKILVVKVAPICWSQTQSNLLPRRYSLFYVDFSSIFSGGRKTPANIDTILRWV